MHADSESRLRRRTGGGLCGSTCAGGAARAAARRELPEEDAIPSCMRGRVPDEAADEALSRSEAARLSLARRARSRSRTAWYMMEGEGFEAISGADLGNHGSLQRSRGTWPCAPSRRRWPLRALNGGLKDIYVGMRAVEGLRPPGGNAHRACGRAAGPA